jgi:hypothetical protein
MRTQAKRFRCSLLVWGAAIALIAQSVYARGQTTAQVQGQPTQGQEANPGNPNPDLTRQQVAEMDQFLDGHPDIDRQLRANPALINDPGYLKANPQLQTFMNQHPGMAEEFRETPSYFMARENRFDARETRRTNLTPKQMEDRDKWLDKHKDIDRDLRSNPELVNDKDYMDRHKDLRDFLDKEPNVRSDFSARASVNINETPANRLTTGDQDEKNRFFDKHKDIAKDLRDHPDDVHDRKYLDHHKDLREFLDKNPRVREEANANPSAFAAGNRDRDAGRSSYAKRPPNNKPSDDKPDTQAPPKTPTEQPHGGVATPGSPSR